jgi:hypothetical protein
MPMNVERRGAVKDLRWKQSISPVDLITQLTTI